MTVKNKHYIFLLVFGILTLLQKVNAQGLTKDITTQNLAWFLASQTTEFSPNLYSVIEIQERVFINPIKQHQFVSRLHVHYKLGSGWDAGIGFTYFLQSPHDPASESTLTIPEYRPQIEFNYKQAVGKRLQFKHRYKAEWRFFQNVKDGELAPGTWNYFRFRYRFGVDFLLYSKANGANALTLQASDEVMINAGAVIILNSFDQNRFTIGLDYHMSPSWNVGLAYVNWFQERALGVNYYSRNIIQLSLAYHLCLHCKN